MNFKKAVQNIEAQKNEMGENAYNEKEVLGFMNMFKKLSRQEAEVKAWGDNANEAIRRLDEQGYWV